MAPPHLLTISSVKEPTKNMSNVCIFGPLCHQVCRGIIYVVSKKCSSHNQKHTFVQFYLFGLLIFLA